MQKNITQSPAFPETGPTQSSSHHGRTGTCMWVARQGFGGGGYRGRKNPTLQQGKNVRGPPLRRRRWQRQGVMNLLQPPHPILLHHSGVEGEKIRVKLSLGRREGWVKVFFRFGFLSPYPTLVLFVIKLVFLSQVCLVHKGVW